MGLESFSDSWRLTEPLVTGVGQRLQTGEVQRLQAASSCWLQSQSRLLKKNNKKAYHQDLGWAQAHNQLLEERLFLGSNIAKPLFNHRDSLMDLTFRPGLFIKHGPLSKINN